MDIQIEKNTENKLFGRREILFSLSYAGATPKKDEIKQELCKKLSLNPEFTIIIKINPLFGTTVSEALAHSYSSKEGMSVEQSYLSERSNKKEKKAKQQAAAAAPAPAEEPKQEAKQEKAETKNEEKEKKEGT